MRRTRPGLAVSALVTIGCLPSSAERTGPDQDAASRVPITPQKCEEQTQSMDAGLPVHLSRTEPGCVTGVAVGFDQTCALAAAGTPWCWGPNDAGQLGIGATSTGNSLPAQLTALGAVSQIDLSGSHGCAIKVNGTLWCWGDNDWGQLGDGTVEPRPLPVQVSVLGSNVTHVGLGALYTCARTGDGALWCWGYDYDGQLGDGEHNETPHPVPGFVAGLEGPVQDFSTGAAHACARLSDGSLACWGNNRTGQLGIGTITDTEPTPVVVNALGHAVEQVAAASGHTCARKQDGTLWCWGSDGSGELGNGSRASNVPVPTQVSALCASVVTFDTGASHTCAVKHDGALFCWGDNALGQVGLPLGEFRALRPVRIDFPGSSVADVRSGSAHTCARTVDGRLHCWGSNSRRQLGSANETGNAPIGEGTELCAAPMGALEPRSTDDDLLR